MHSDHVTQIFKSAQIDVENKSAQQGVAVFSVPQKKITQAVELLKKNRFIAQGALSTHRTLILYFSLDLNFEFFLVGR